MNVIDALLDDVRETLVEHARSAVMKRRTPAPLAVVIGSDSRVVTVSLLDASQRVEVIQKALEEYRASGFIFLHDGFVVIDGQRRDALLIVQMTEGAGRAIALPYRPHPLNGVVFDDPVEAAEVPSEYRSIRFCESQAQAAT